MVGYKNIYFESDFSVTLSRTEGWAQPFRLVFFSDSLGNAIPAEYDGTNYTNCYVDGNGNLVVSFADHSLGLGALRMGARYYATAEAFAEDNPESVTPYTPVMDYEGYLIALTSGQSSVTPCPSGPGEKGEKGDKGDIGPAGPRGYQGETGPQGAKGEKGDQGEAGPQGPQGERGLQGETGPQGAKGDKGDQGEAGPAGPQGERGLQGETGPQGAKGEKGDKGEAGPQGPQGERGLQGEAGPQGAKGDKGDQGEAGPAGPQGERGLQGETGPQGERGPQGEQGPKGDSPTQEQLTQLVADGIAQQIAEAPASFDTLKEISAWIESHPKDASAINAQLVENANAIATETTRATEAETAMNLQIQENAEKNAEQDEKLTELEQAVNHVEGVGTALQDSTNAETARRSKLQSIQDLMSTAFSNIEIANLADNVSWDLVNNTNGNENYKILSIVKQDNGVVDIVTTGIGNATGLIALPLEFNQPYSIRIEAKNITQFQIYQNTTATHYGDYVGTFNQISEGVFEYSTEHFSGTSAFLWFRVPYTETTATIYHIVIYNHVDFQATIKEKGLSLELQNKINANTYSHISELYDSQNTQVYNVQGKYILYNGTYADDPKLRTDFIPVVAGQNIHYDIVTAGSGICLIAFAQTTDDTNFLIHLKTISGVTEYSGDLVVPEGYNYVCCSIWVQSANRYSILQTINILSVQEAITLVQQQLDSLQLAQYPLQQYKLWTIGDSLAEPNKFQNKIVQVTKIQYDAAKNIDAQYKLSAGGTNSFGGTMSGIRRTRNLINSGWIEGDGDGHIILFEQYNDTSQVPQELDYTAPINTAEQFLDTELDKSNLSAYLQSVDSTLRKESTILTMREKTYCTSKRLKITSLPTKSGIITLRVGWPGNATRYPIEVTTEMTVSDIYNAILAWDYGNVTDTLNTSENSIDFSIHGAYEVLCRFEDTESTGLGIEITAFEGGTMFTQFYFVGTSAEWEDITKWLTDSEFGWTSAMKSQIQMVQKAYPKAVVCWLYPPHLPVVASNYVDGGYVDMEEYWNAASGSHNLDQIEVAIVNTRKICQLYGVNFIDAHSQAGFSPQTQLIYYPTNSSVHPNDAGYIKLGQFVANELTNYVKAE